LSYSIKSQLQEEKEARLNKTPEKEARGNMKLMYDEKERKCQWGSGGLQAWPETGS